MHGADLRVIKRKRGGAVAAREMKQGLVPGEVPRKIVDAVEIGHPVLQPAEAGFRAACGLVDMCDGMRGPDILGLDRNRLAPATLGGGERPVSSKAKA